MDAGSRVSGGSTAAPVKVRTAALSVLSNAILILLKLIAGTVTGSVAILTEAVHSSIDLVASLVAFFSVRKADEPADESQGPRPSRRRPARPVRRADRPRGPA